VAGLGGPFMMRVETRDRECWHCSGRTGLGLVCLHCEAPQPLPPAADLFAVLGLPRHLVVDPTALEERYHAASRVVHPDRHQAAAERSRELSLAASAAVNRAYRTLRDPVARGRYWLELHGAPLGERNNRVPPALAALVFETQEQLEALRDGGGAGARPAVEAVRGELEERVRGLVSELEERYAAWDAADPTAAGMLDELKRRLSEIAYLSTLQGDVEEALEERERA
jgi:molecular chaperone HscB